MLPVSLMVPCHHNCHPASLCTFHLVLPAPVVMTKLSHVQDGNSRALVTGRSVFRRPLSGTNFLPTSDTAVPSHSSKLLLKPSSLLLPSLSYLDLLQDFCFCLFSWTVLCVLLICQWKGEGGREEGGEREGRESYIRHVPFTRPSPAFCWCFAWFQLNMYCALSLMSVANWGIRTE